MLIKKRADHLVPGDIVVTQHPPMPGSAHGAPMVTVRRVVLREDSVDDDTASFTLAVIGGPTVLTAATYFTPHEPVDVEVPDPLVTAEELVMLVTCGHLVVDGGLAHPDRLPALLDRLDPPKSPTMDEVLAVLVNLEPKLRAVIGGTEDRRVAPALEILERARRAGAIK
jgi:hypothetical protein